MQYQVFTSDTVYMKRVKLTGVVHQIGEAKENQPLLVFLHSAGERGVEPHIYSKQAYKPTRNFEGVVACPICEQGNIFDADAVAQFALDVSKEFKTDKKRIYLSGFSMGARCVWNAAVAQPNLYAALLPISGYSCYLCAPQVYHIPTWCFHGRHDDVVPVMESIKMVGAMKECGGKPKLTILEEFSHGMPYEDILQTEVVSEWMLKQINNRI